MGGPYHDRDGSGANYLCMPSAVQYNTDAKANGKLVAWIYAATYQTKFYKNGNSPLADGKDLHDRDVPCAVCRSKNPSSFMLPAMVRQPTAIQKIL